MTGSLGTVSACETIDEAFAIEDAASPEATDYEVEAILDHSDDFEGGVMHYLVAWKGYPPEENLWIPSENAIGCKALLEEYQKRWGVIDQHWKKRKTAKQTKQAKRSPSQTQSQAIDHATAGAALPPPPTRTKRKATSTVASKSVAGGQRRLSSRLRAIEKSRRTLDDLTFDDLDAMSDVEERRSVQRRIGEQRFGSMTDWESIVQRIDGTHMEGEVTAVRLDFAGGFRFAYPLEIVRERCPQRLIDYLTTTRPPVVALPAVIDVDASASQSSIATVVVGTAAGAVASDNDEHTIPETQDPRESS